MKICHNNCKMGWCCSGESFMSSPERWDKESVEFSKLKGVIPYETTDKNVLYVHIYCPCIQLKDGKCNIHSCKPKGCQDFPTARHEGMVLTEKCLYFDPNKHISFEKLKPYEPKE